jgi:hypothetical protein
MSSALHANKLAEFIFWQCQSIKGAFSTNKPQEEENEQRRHDIIHHKQILNKENTITTTVRCNHLLYPFILLKLIQ